MKFDIEIGWSRLCSSIMQGTVLPTARPSPDSCLMVLAKLRLLVYRSLSFRRSGQRIQALKVYISPPHNSQKYRCRDCYVYNLKRDYKIEVSEIQLRPGGAELPCSCFRWTEYYRILTNHVTVYSWECVSIHNSDDLIAYNAALAVGACIVNDEKKIVGIGYNGMPNGCSDDLLPWNRVAEDPLDTKYFHGSISSSLCVAVLQHSHAEWLNIIHVVKHNV